MKIAKFVLMALLSAVLGACVAAEVLEPKSPNVPVGIDFTGRWLIDESGGASAQHLRNINVGEAEDILKEARRARNGQTSRRKSDTAVHVFLEAGKELKVTQTDHGLFISFDRSIVEEYRFGENTSVNVGPIVAARVSGWEGRNYIIETLDEEGAKLIERYFLEDEGRRMRRQVALWEKKQQTFLVEQLYDRQ
jgi:hypothetical protein